MKKMRGINTNELFTSSFFNICLKDFASGGLAQNFSAAMVDCLLTTRKDSNIFLQKGPFLRDFEGGGGPVRHWA